MPLHVEMVCLGKKVEKSIARYACRQDLTVRAVKTYRKSYRNVAPSLRVPNAVNFFLTWLFLLENAILQSASVQFFHHHLPPLSQYQHKLLHPFIRTTPSANGLESDECIPMHMLAVEFLIFHAATVSYY